MNKKPVVNWFPASWLLFISLGIIILLYFVLGLFDMEPEQVGIIVR